MCTDLINSYKCTCETGYQGSNCDSQTPPLPDQCSNYKSLTSSKRHFNYTTSDSKCDFTGNSDEASDWDGEGWYRVEGSAGSQLSEKYSSWKYDSCGTDHGGHLTGGHPALAGQTVTRTVCFYKNVCTGAEKRSIKVTNCNGYYVYHLPQVSGCYRGYCTQ